MSNNLIGGHLNSYCHELENGATLYDCAGDAKNSRENATPAGVKAIVEPVDIGFEIFGQFADLDGNDNGVFQDN